jgi:hypothetical protein
VAGARAAKLLVCAPATRALVAAVPRGDTHLPPPTSTATTESTSSPATRALLVSTAASPTPFLGGMVVPVPVLFSLGFVTTPAGGFRLDLAPWPRGLRPGMQVVWQCGVLDAGAVQGLALSNAVAGRQGG